MLQILLPLKVMQISPGAPAALLGAVAAQGAAVAGISNVGFGWLSDRTVSRFGRRRPWIAAGLAGVLCSYGLIGQARSIGALFAAFAVFQLMVNMMFAPLLALVSDRVPAARRGWVAALVALGSPVGAALGAVVIGSLLGREADRLIALGVMVVLCIAPFVWALGPDPPVSDDVAAQGAAAGPAPRWLSANFMLGWCSRASVICAFAVAQLYILFYVAGFAGRTGAPAAAGRVALLAAIFGVVSAGAGIGLGMLSDWTGRRKPFVIGAALTVAAGMAALALAPSWPHAVLAYTVFALGAGGYTAVEFALMVDILPSRDRKARDLGVLNLSNIAPQIGAPLGVTLLLAQPGASIHAAFAAAALAAALGAALAGFIRRVP